MDPMTMSAIFGIGGKIIDRLFPDPEQKAKAELELVKMQAEGQFKMYEMLGQSDNNQTDVNVEEAKSDSIFKSGWRPYIGWVCGGALSYQMLFRPIFSWVAKNAWAWESMPSLEMESLMSLMFGILGLGAYRTFEKTRGAR